MVEGTGLENRRRFTPSAGSNPASSVFGCLAFSGVGQLFLSFVSIGKRRSMILSARLRSSGRFVKFATLVFLLVNFWFPLKSVYAQPSVVQGVQGVINSVRPRGLIPRNDNAASPPPLFGEVRGANTNSLTKGNFFDPYALYSVDVKNVSWVSYEGMEVSALLYVPATPPVRDGSFSAVVFSHGLGSSAEDFSYLAYTWASRGVVTLCLRHPDSDETVWRGKIRPMNELKTAYQRCWSARDRAKAIRSGIDFLYWSSDADVPWGRYLDLSKIGVSGNDLGALGALLTAGQLPPDNGPSLNDPRVASVLALSPPVFCEKEHGPYVYGAIRVPTMVVTGTNDNGVVGATKAPQRRIPYDSIQKVDKYLVVLLDGDHRVYAGRKVGAKQVTDRAYQETIARQSADFWTAYLSNDGTVLEQMRSYGKTGPLSNVHIERQLGDRGGDLDSSF